MSEAIAFDTHRFVKRLTESETLRQEIKADIDALRQETKADLAKVQASVDALRHETTAAIATMKADLVKWLFGALIAQGGLIVALLSILL